MPQTQNYPTNTTTSKLGASQKDLTNLTPMVSPVLRAFTGDHTSLHCSHHRNNIIMESDISEDTSSDVLEEGVTCRKSAVKNYQFYFPNDTDASFNLIDSSSDDEFDDDTDSSFAPYMSGDEQSDFGEDNDYEFETQFEEEQTRTENSPPPFWYACEESDHVEAIIERYTESFVNKADFTRSNQPFVGRVERIAANTNGKFQTFDHITIQNNQRMPEFHQAMPEITDYYCLTTWDSDGIPEEFFPLGHDLTLFWDEKLRDEKRSYLYKQPDYFCQERVVDTRFIFSSSADFRDVCYSNIPWDSSPYSRCVDEVLRNHKTSLPAIDAS